MGVKFGVDDSVNLIGAMRHNVTTANAIVDRLFAGLRHLVGQLDAGVLQGAAYTAGRGLFAELIIPGIAKLNDAVDDIQAELASYEYDLTLDSGYFYLHDEQGRVARNLNYGTMLAHWGVELETALKGANLHDGVLAKDVGVINDGLDDRAVAFGYELYRKYPNGLTKEQYYEEIANAGLVDDE